MNSRILLTMLVLAGLAACGSETTLVQRSAVTPSGADLSGLWLLRQDGSASNERIARAGSTAADDQAVIPGMHENRPRRPARSRSGLVHVFLETGEALKITQTPHGMFVSFDRSVVEEYRFGELREVNVGPVTAQRASGWDGDSYVIQTLDDDGLILTERYSLLEDSDLLVRQITIQKRDSIELDARQLFDRQPER